MAKKIGVEPELTPVTEFLKDKGYDVVNVNFGITTDITINNFDAIVVTGSNENFLGMEDTFTKGKVINATGLTPPEIESKIRSIG